MTRALLATVLVAFAAGCGSSSGTPDAGDASSTTPDAPIFSGEGGPSPSDGSACDPPDMLVVLDHTDSMSRTPGGSKPPDTDAGLPSSKWVLACDAVSAIVAPPADQGLRFGLELFPLDPDVVTDAGATGQCQTLSALLSGSAPNNTKCDPGEVLVSPATGTGTQIQTLLDPYTLRLCVSTPINAALQTAQQTLSAIATPGRDQYVILVTDGAETCVTDSDVIATAQAMTAAGIHTYVVGFGAADAGSQGVNVGLLNNVACAGMTATGFSTACTKQAAGYVAANPNGPPLFYLAEDGASLESALSSVTRSVCCGCVH